MILFRLISFGFRVFFSFLFVFLLQVKWDQKPLEQYLTYFAKSFFATQVLNQVSKDGTKVIRYLSGSSKLDKSKKKSTRKITSIAQKLILDAEKRLSPPAITPERK